MIYAVLIVCYVKLEVILKQAHIAPVQMCYYCNNC